MKRSILCMTISLALIGCKEQSNAPSNPQTQSTKDVVERVVTHQQSGYGSVGINNSWPAVSEQDIEVSNNLLASNYYLVLDGSGSMDRTSCGAGQRRIDVAKTALSTFVSSLPNDAQIGLYVFDGRGANERAALKAGGEHKQFVIDQIKLVESNDGTPLGASLIEAYNSLTAQAKKQLGYGTFHSVIVTDGDAGDTGLMNRMVDKIVGETAINLHTMGFCIGASHALNRQGYVNYQSASNPEQLLAGLSSVTAEAEAFNVDTEFKE